MTKEFFSVRSHQIAILIITAFSVTCTQIPLLNYLGFEFSALTTLVSSIIVGLLTISAWRRRQLASGGSLEQFIDTAVLYSLLVAVIPFVIMSLNAFFVKNCSYVEGAILFLLLVLPAVALAQAIALCIAVGFTRWNKTLFLLIHVGILLHIPFVTFTGIQIFAFNPIMGFFPGFTYDETLNVIGRLVVYRVETVAMIVLFWLFTFWLEKGKKVRGPWSGVVPIKQRWIAGGLGLIIVAFVWFSDDLGLSSSLNSVKSRLGGETETEHFIIRYPSGMKHTQVQDIVLLHEFYFDQISKELRVSSHRKIESFVYESPEQKGRLVGAARTDISKPWLWQLHINLDDVEQSLKHELVHVMAAEFGSPLFRISTNSGLIEGAAVAVERVAYDAVVHRAAALAFAIDVRVNMGDLFSVSGFFKAHPGVSYTLAGSFCRYLIDHYGLRRFKRVYRTGDFNAAYNRDFERLIADWRQYLTMFEVKDPEKRKAAYLFKRPSIFGKECARVIANLNAETRSMYLHKDYPGALASSSQSLGLTTNTDAIYQKTNSLFRLKRYSDAIKFAEEKLSDSSFVYALLPLNLVLGDSYWASGFPDKALVSYHRVFEAHISLPLDEASALRLSLIFNRRKGEILRPFFIEEMDDSVRMAFLESVNEKDGAPLKRYLLGRELARKEKYRDAIEAFSRKGKMEMPILDFLQKQRLGQIYFKVGEFQKAKLSFWDSLNDVTNEAYFIETEEWLKRCDWMEEHATKPNL